MEPGKLYLILGGARSGKSTYALELADRLGKRKLFVATAEPRDQEMKDRIAAHRSRRGTAWETVEEPVCITDLLGEKAGKYEVILIDCLTLWLSNLILRYEKKEVGQFLEDFIQMLGQIRGCHVILVSNEVGMGIVPENRLARAFRDWAGLMNQRVAQTADEVILMIAGIPTKIKGRSAAAPLQTERKPNGKA